VGGTSGSCDWRRRAADEDAVRPGDLVLPKSYLTRDTMPTGLPGTELEFCLPRQVAIMDDPFCPPLAEALRADAERLADFRFRRVHGPDSGVVLNRWLAGNGFESLATCRMLEASGRQIGMPVITGDCVSPVLARVCVPRRGGRADHLPVSRALARSTPGVRAGSEPAEVNSTSRRLS
jgi:hypothetical protein